MATKHRIINTVIRMATWISLILIAISCGEDEEGEKVHSEKTATKGTVTQAQSGATPAKTVGGKDVLSLTYTEDIKPFMDNSCAFSHCHSNAKAESGFNYETYAATADGILGAISSIERGVMPVKGYPEVSQEHLDMLQAWYELGMPE